MNADYSLSIIVKGMSTDNDDDDDDDTGDDGDGDDNHDYYYHCEWRFYALM